MLRSAAIIVLAWALILGAFFVLPIGRQSGLREVVRIGADIALIGALVAWQIRRISVAELPELRAGGGPRHRRGGLPRRLLGASTSRCRTMRSANFTQPLDQTRALYFTITVFSTVGFGDITPRTDPARLIVAAQMLLDLALIGAGVRLILNVAKTRVASAGGSAAADE